MRKVIFSLLLSFSFMNIECQAAPLLPIKENKPAVDEEGIVLFTPPLGWNMVDSKSLPATVKVMVVGKGEKSFPPSINMSTEPYKGTLKQYLKIVKSMNESQGYDWKDLGSIKTEAGLGSLSQVDTKTEWGTTRLMHVILVKSNRVYILTASALKDEFSKYYKDFFAAMRSLRISKDVFEMVATPQRRSQLKAAYDNVQNQWKAALAQKQKEQPEILADQIKKITFESPDFQNNTWKPFQELVNQKFSDMGKEWQTFVLQKTESDLFETKSPS
jgi:hypothetical protein